MFAIRRSWWSLTTMLVSLGFVVGCGGGTSPTQVAENSNQTPADQIENEPTGLPTLAIPGLKPAAKTPAKPANDKGEAPAPKGLDQSSPKKSDQPTGKKADSTATPPAELPAVRKEPVKGSPEWLLLEIQRVKILPLPGMEPKSLPEKKGDEKEDLEDEPEDKPLTAEEEQRLKEQFEKTKAVRRERNLQIIKLAEECIAKTARQQELEAEFDAAVHYLLDARLQLALQGDAASIEALFDAAKVFYDRKPQSASAVEAQLTLVNLTHANALRYGQTQPKWIQEFARHAQLYATRFPDEQDRAVSLLAAAARSCELNGLNDEARNCYSLLTTQFKDTPQAKQAEGVVLRMQLKGKPLELVGPTIDGDELNIETYRGKMVVIVFWATHAKPFVDQLPRLLALGKKYEKYATIVGVNLDADENAVEGFVEKTGMAWPQIFSPNRALRGWNSPLAVKYGINTLPTIWLVDPNGVVADTSIVADTLEPRMKDVYKLYLNNTVKPASGVK